MTTEQLTDMKASSMCRILEDIECVVIRSNAGYENGEGLCDCFNELQGCIEWVEESSPDDYNIEKEYQEFCKEKTDSINTYMACLDNNILTLERLVKDLKDEWQRLNTN